MDAMSAYNKIAQSAGLKCLKIGGVQELLRRKSVMLRNSHNSDIAST